MRILFDTVEDGLTPTLADLRRRLSNRRSLNLAAAAGMKVPIQRNFLELSSTNHNPFGVRSTFWGLMNAGTVAGADDSNGWVDMPPPVALRRFGGTVYPGAGKKRLSLPARTEAYGKSPRDFPDLQSEVMGRKTDGTLAIALVQNAQQKVSFRKTKNGVKTVKGAVKGGLVFFWLVPSATIRPDPRVMPTQDILLAAGRDGVGTYLSHLGRRR